MLTLFPEELHYPPGFSYYPDFLDEKEEAQLLDVISQTELHSFIFQGFEAKRRVASFGFDWSFEKKMLSKGKEIPAGFQPLIKKLAQRIAIDEDKFAELLVLEYPIDAVINWHRDAPPFDVIAGISLLSDCIFKFRPYDKTRQGRSAVISLPVKRRSLYIISGEARSAWEHSTAPVKQKRYSITLRTLK